MDNSFSRDEQFLALLSDHSSDELKEIFDKSLKNRNDTLAQNLNKLCSDSLSLIQDNQAKNDSITTQPSEAIAIRQGETTYINKTEIIEKYTKKLLLLQQKLNENLSMHREEKENMCMDGPELSVSNENKCMDIQPSNKINFKDLSGFKKDIVVKKLLKTIDLMNQELSKRDKLISNMEKENNILESEKQKKIFQTKGQDIINQSQETLREISRLKQEIKNERYEKEIAEQKIEILSQKFINSQQNEKLSFKELENLKLVQKTNDDLKVKIDELSTKVKADAIHNKFELEVNDKFESLIKEKTTLEIENSNLISKVLKLSDKLNDIEEFSKAELLKCVNNFENEISELQKSTKEKELSYKSALTIYENQLKSVNISLNNLNEEKKALTESISQNQEEKLHLHNQLESYVNLELRYNELKEKFDTVSYANFEQQNKIEQLVKESETKSTDNIKNSQKKCDELKRLKQAHNLGQEKLKYLQTKHETESQAIKKQFSKEIEQFKFTNEQISIRNGELSRSNAEIRKKNRQLENDLKDANEKCFINKKNADLYTKQKKELKEEVEKTTKDLKNQIIHLEKMRDVYLKKNNSQQESVEDMLQQIASFKAEFERLVSRNSYLEEKSKKLNSQCDVYKEKYSELRAKFKKVSANAKSESKISDSVRQSVIENALREYSTKNLDRNDEQRMYEVAKYQQDVSIELSQVQYEDYVEEAD